MTNRPPIIGNTKYKILGYVMLDQAACFFFDKFNKKNHCIEAHGKEALGVVLIKT